MTNRIDMQQIAALCAASMEKSRLARELYLPLHDRAEEIARVIERVRKEKAFVKQSNSDRFSPGSWVEWYGKVEIAVHDGTITASYIERGCMGNPDETMHSIDLTDEMLRVGFETTVAREIALDIDDFLKRRGRETEADRKQRIEDLRNELRELEQQEQQQAAPPK